MKRIMILSVIFAIFFYFLSSFSGCIGDYATKDDLDALEHRLKNEIEINRDQIYITQEKVDSVKEKVILLQINQDTMKNQLYRIEQGQIVIYSAIKNTEDQPAQTREIFLQRLRSLLGL